MIETSQTIPELISWAKEREFSLNLPTERLVFLLAIAIYNNERLDGEMLEADLVDIFRLNPYSQCLWPINGRDCHSCQ